MAAWSSDWTVEATGFDLSGSDGSDVRYLKIISNPEAGWSVLGWSIGGPYFAAIARPQNQCISKGKQHVVQAVYPVYPFSTLFTF